VRSLVGTVHGEVVAGPGENSGEDLPGDFDKHVGYDEGGPGVGLGGPLTDFVQGALNDEFGHDPGYCWLVLE
jgi:hypothetical protein